MLYFISCEDKMKLLFLMLAWLPVWALDTPNDSGEVTLFGETGVFQPIQSGEAIVSPSGHLYVVNFEEAYINHYGPDGTRYPNIGSKGKGPGEFTYITSLQFLNGKLYAMDLLDGQISILDEDGKFQSRVKAPSRGLALAITTTGWLYGDWDSWSADEKGKLFLTNDQFKENKVLMEMKEKTFGQGSWVMTDDGKTEATFRPISTHPHLITSPDGNNVYMSDPMEFKIYCFDGSGKYTTIERKDKRIPFDLDWAQEGLKEANGRQKDGTRFQLIAPEYFPAIRKLAIGPRGNLIVDRWRGRPDDNHYPIALDSKGNEIEMEFDWQVIERMVGVAGNHIYLTIFNKDGEEAGVARLPLSKANEYVKSHPIEYEGSIGHSISISN